MELNHLHLNSADVEQTAAFYARWFGFRRHKLVDDGALLFMRNERDFDLALSNEGEERALPRWFHFGFRLDSAERVRSLRGEMELSGVHVGRLWDDADYVSFRVKDPNGYSIEVYWE